MDSWTLTILLACLSLAIFDWVIGVIMDEEDSSDQ